MKPVSFALLFALQWQNPWLLVWAIHVHKLCWFYVLKFFVSGNHTYSKLISHKSKHFMCTCFSRAYIRKALSLNIWGNRIVPHSFCFQVQLRPVRMLYKSANLYSLWLNLTILKWSEYESIEYKKNQPLCHVCNV